jgi:hypothetical protein
VYHNKVITIGEDYWGVIKVYYRQLSPWYTPFPSNQQQITMTGDIQMMDMMREHIRMTKEIRRVVYEINERCKRMESKMMR